MWKFISSKRSTHWIILREQLEVAEFLGAVKQRVIDADGCVDHLQSIVAGEHAIALEDILSNVYECSIYLSNQELIWAGELGRRLGLEAHYWEDLDQNV